MSIRMACKEKNITPKMFREWKKKYNALTSHRRRARRMHPGRKSSIPDEAEDAMIEWLILKREAGNHVNYDMLERKLGELDATFRRKTPNAKKHIIRRISARNKFVYRASTHTAQRPPEEVRGEARQFVAETIPRLATSYYGRRDKDFIINMDQTPVFFTMATKYTLELVGTRSVPSLGTPHLGSTSRATAFLSITANGKFLKSLVVFKGTEGGKVSREFPDYNPGALYQAQTKAWCDKRVMLYWINNILGPYIRTAPPDVRPVLLLDRYSCHIMDEVVDLIFAMGVEIVYVPGGCTSLAQPLDVGINKPFKDRIRKKWEQWVTHEKAIYGEDHKPKVPRYLIARWIVKAARDINETIGKNAWLHAPYNYFSVDNEDEN